MKNVLLALFAVVAFSSCTLIGPNERGVRYSFGKVSDDVLESGTHFWLPYFVGSKSVNVKMTALEIKTNSGTKDQQEVTTQVVINTQIDPAKVVSLVREFGSEDGLDSTVNPLIHAAISAKVSKYSAEEVLTKREQLKMDIQNEIKSSLEKYPVIVHDVSIKDLQYSNEYARAIEQKQIAEQKAKQAEYETLKITQDAKSVVAQAEGAAKASLLKAKAEAEANQLKLRTLTKELIQYEAIQRWNGQLPQVNGGGTLPMINITGANGATK